MGLRVDRRAQNIGVGGDIDRSTDGVPRAVQWLQPFVLYVDTLYFEFYRIAAGAPGAYVASGHLFHALRTVHCLNGRRADHRSRPTNFRRRWVWIAGPPYKKRAVLLCDSRIDRRC